MFNTNIVWPHSDMMPLHLCLEGEQTHDNGDQLQAHYLVVVACEKAVEQRLLWFSIGVVHFTILDKHGGYPWWLSSDVAIQFEDSARWFPECDRLGDTFL